MYDKQSMLKHRRTEVGSRSSFFVVFRLSKMKKLTQWCAGFSCELLQCGLALYYIIHQTSVFTQCMAQRQTSMESP